MLSPVVPRVGFEPTSPRLQRGAFTRLASSAEMVRASVIETESPEWRSGARPSSYVRMVGSGRNRTSCPQGPRLRRGDGTSLSLWHFPCLFFVPPGMHRAVAAYETAWLLIDLPAKKSCEYF